MKKFIIPAVLITALLISSCGKGKDGDSSKSPDASPKSTFLVLGETPSSGVDGDIDNPEQSGDPEQENGAGSTPGTGSANNGKSHSNSVSIINGSSTSFHAVYLTTSANGNPGENIIGDTPLDEGEEIVLQFANAPSESLTIIVEDENGIRYSAGGVNLANGLTIELHLEGGVLSAYVY